MDLREGDAGIVPADRAAGGIGDADQIEAASIGAPRGRMGGETVVGQSAPRPEGLGIVVDSQRVAHIDPGVGTVRLADLGCDRDAGDVPELRAAGWVDFADGGAAGGVGAATGAGEEVEGARAAALTDVASTLGAEEAGGRGPLDCSGFGAEDGDSCPPMVG